MGIVIPHVEGGQRRWEKRKVRDLGCSTQGHLELGKEVPMPGKNMANGENGKALRDRCEGHKMGLVGY